MYMGIDLGTSSVKTVLMDAAQHIVATASASFDVMRPHDSWSEQNPADWIAGVENTFTQLKASNAKELAAVSSIGLSGHMHGATLLDSADKVLRPCILWNDTRSHEQAAALDTDLSRELCGNILFPGFTAPKLVWTETCEPDVFASVAKVLLPKDYLRLWLTGEHVSEMSDAAGTGWLDVARRDWSDKLLAACNMDTSHMPQLVEGTAVSGKLRSDIANRFGLSDNVVVAGGAGDNAASACGMGVVAPGSAFVSLGTSGVLFASNESYRPNAASAVHTFCHAIPETWHQMGVMLAATDSLNWLAGVTGKSAADLSASLEGKTYTPTDVLFLPYLGGERTPHNDANARGVFVGLSHTTDSEELTTAVMQGVCFAFRDSLNALNASGTRLDSAYAIGGGSRSDYWISMMATVLNIPLHKTVDGDFGASLGAARLGLIAAEQSDPLQVCVAPPIESTIEPLANMAELIESNYARFKSCYTSLKPVFANR